MHIKRLIRVISLTSVNKRFIVRSVTEESKSCGIVLPDVNFALTSGYDEEKVAPWTVSLGDNDDNGLHSHFCTGIIIKGILLEKSIVFTKISG